MLKEIETLSSAEDFFTFFGIAFAPRVLAASRLHILKRFHDYLAEHDRLEILDRNRQFAVYRDCLARAYADFVSAPALSRKVFSRLVAIGNAFVPLANVDLHKRQPPSQSQA